jgi:acetylornithine deacetylase/succinyl-diaminopimelate desuccinylase-like protein
MQTLATITAGLLLAAAAQAQVSSADYTRDYQRAALEMYRDVVAMRTAEGHGKIPEMAAYLARQFLDAGFFDNEVRVLPHTLPTGEEVASVVVRYRGNGLAGRKPILLLAHMDIVDALPSDWERDPFKLIEEDGFFFGRGTLDNKLGIVSLTSAFQRLMREEFTPTRDLIIAFTGDEETHMETIRALVTEHRDLTDAEFVLNADAGNGFLDHDHNPAGYLLQSAEKTYATFELTIRNPGGHSSQPRADNAIYELATVLKNIEAYRFPARINDTTRDYFEKLSTLVPGDVGAAMRDFARNQGDEEARAVLEGQPSHVGITRTTCVATMLQAGHAENALPQTATATVNCRIFPGISIESVRQRLFSAADNDNLEITVSYEGIPSPESPLREDVTGPVTDAVRAHYGDVPVINYMAPYGTDGAHTRVAGMPTFGVSGLFIREQDIFAHGLNERVPVRSFYAALDYWYQLLTELGSER